MISGQSHDVPVGLHDVLLDESRNFADVPDPRNVVPYECFCHILFYDGLFHLDEFGDAERLED